MQMMESFNPMSSDFNNEEFNRYRAAQGVSSDAIVQLKIYGIPSCLTENGLRNLLSRAGAIISVKLIAYKNIGFVSVRQKDAVKIIAYFHNYKLGDGYLNVRPVKRLAQQNKVKQTENEPSDAGTASANAEEQKQFASKLVDEIHIPALNYPAASKYLQVGEELPIRVLSVISPSQFWIRCCSSKADGELKELHAKMTQHYSSLPPKTGFRPNGSGLYAAPSRVSGNWCRMQALKYDTESVHLLLLDYGTCEQIRLTELHSLEGQFCSLPFQAICCSLAHVKGVQSTPRWTVEAATCMCQLLTDEQVRAKVCQIDRYNLSVELILSSGKTVNDELVSRNCATYENGYEPGLVQANVQRTAALDSGSNLDELSKVSGIDHPTIKDLNHVPLKVAEQYDVVVLHARNAGDVTVCLTNNIGDFRALMMEMSSYQQSDVYVPCISEMVAAKYAVDGSWYRAKVLTLDSDSTAVVRFVDFGNTATVNFKSVAKLQPRHATFPVLGINIAFGSSNVDSTLLAEYRSLRLKVIEQRGSRYVVSLIEDGTETTQLGNHPSSQSTYSVSDISQSFLDTGKTYIAYVTDGTDVENFYVQVEEIGYLATHEQIQVIYVDKSGGYEPQQVGELIAIHLDEDNAWYRAVVKDIDDKKAIKCQLIDFGTVVTSVCKDIRQFDSRLLVYPAYAFQCSFHGDAVSAASAWKDEDLMPMTAVYYMTVVEIKGDRHSVELVELQSGVNMKQKLIDSGLLVKAQSSDFQPVVSPSSVDKPSANDQRRAESSHHRVHSEQMLAYVPDTEVCRLCSNREKIVVVHANSPSDFFIQSGSNSVQQKLRSLHRSINDFCRQSPCKPDAIAIGQIVGVKHDNGTWYRGEVMDAPSHGKFQVHFVDLGITKTAESSELRPLPDALAVFLPVQAVHCAIDRVVGCEPDGRWSSSAVEWFRSTCENNEFTLKFIFRNDSGSIWMVDLLQTDTGRAVKDMLLARQLAVQRMNISQRSNRNVSKDSPVLADVDRKQQVRSRPSPPLLSSTLKLASIQADDAVMVTCVYSPSKFFVQTQSQRCEEVLHELNSYYRAHDEAYYPQQVGELIAVMYDSCWRRAEVLSFDARNADVFLIDYGNIVTNVDFQNIRALAVHFASSLPKLAVCCAVSGIRGTRTDGSYSEAAGRWFRDSYLHVTSTVTEARRSSSSGALPIDLKDQRAVRTARQMLLDYEMALASTDNGHDDAEINVQPLCVMPTDIPQPSVKPAVTKSRHFADATVLNVNAVVSVVHCTSPVDFYVLPSNPAALQEMRSLSEKLEQHCITSNRTDYSPQYVGEPVVAKFEGGWYRAEVTNLMSDGNYDVVFVDFGNAAVVGTVDLQSLHEDFVKRPKQAVHCGIDGICGTGGGGEFTDAATEWFKEKFCCGSNATLLSVRIVTGGKHLINMSLPMDGSEMPAKELIVAAGLASYSDMSGS